MLTALPVLALLTACVLATAGNTGCRSRDGVVLATPHFNHHTCALCYFYLDQSHFKSGAKLELFYFPEGGDDVVKLLFREEVVIVADGSDPHDEILNSFLNDEGRIKWTQCCRAAETCCTTMSTSAAVKTEDDVMVCPRTWDGWQCWQDAAPDSVQRQPCPTYSYPWHVATEDEEDCPKFAEKTCESSGSWRRNNFSSEFTDYSPCGKLTELKMLEKISVAAHALTIALTIPALGIFHMFKQLQGRRIALHKNLLVSLLFNAVLVIAFKVSIILRESEHDTSFIDQNFEWCKVLLICTKYFRLTNYLWMFCEGFYLHRLISATFAQETSLLLFYVIGWGFPLLPLLPYTALRTMFEDGNCWALPLRAYHFEWLLYLPPLITLAANFFFLINIIWILMKKLRVGSTDIPSQYRRALRSALVLVPLFGLHFVATLYRPRSGCGTHWRQIYLVADRLLDGLQGAMVAVLYCYSNNEVHVLIRRSMRNAIASFKPNYTSTSLFSTNVTSA